ncbi:MAG: PAS domain-containing sensor histidine kinase [Nocardiopsaceae bacterium]|jgi:signal transduction histidine kinase|nr:PAS domain-containing sensor histidine kinase [Nocardiopsaceae bacterium]
MGEHARTIRQRFRTAPRQTRASNPDEIGLAILAASADGVVAVDDQGTIRFGNHAAARLLGRPADDLVGTPLGHEIAPGQGAEIELSGPAGPRVLDVRTTTTTVAGERFRIAMLRDATQRRQSERAIEATLDQQSAALAVAAHELHSPLAAIGVLAHVLTDQQLTMDMPERTKLAERIADLAERLQMLMRRLLTSVQIDENSASPRPEPVRILEVIVDQLTLVNAEPKAVHVHCSPGIAASVDRAELTMMLANYIDNALTYAKPPIEIIAAQRDDWTEIAVRDNGPGVTKTFEPLLFERFARAPESERQAAGIGLGLWIVRTLARSAGGDAWYEPASGGGSRFLLRLPRVAGDP